MNRERLVERPSGIEGEGGESESGRGRFSCVYFVFSYGLVKIGRTDHLRQRLGGLNRLPFPRGLSGFGVMERVLYVKTDDSVILERELHWLMAPERVVGEWFHLRPDDVEALEDLFGSSMANAEPYATEDSSVPVYSVGASYDEDGPIPLWGK